MNRNTKRVSGHFRDLETFKSFCVALIPQNQGAVQQRLPTLAMLLWNYKGGGGGEKKKKRKKTDMSCRVWKPLNGLVRNAVHSTTRKGLLENALVRRPRVQGFANFSPAQHGRKKKIEAFGARKSRPMFERVPTSGEGPNVAKVRGYLCLRVFGCGVSPQVTEKS